MSRYNSGSGVIGHVDSPDSDAFVFSHSQSYTFTCWVRHDVLDAAFYPYQTYIRMDSGASVNGSGPIYCVRSFPPSHRIEFFCGDGAGTLAIAQTPGGVTLTKYVWHFIACVRDVAAGTIKLYTAYEFAGALTLQATTADTTTSSHGDYGNRLMIGARMYDHLTLGVQLFDYIQGEMEYATIWGSALTASDLDQVRQNTLVSGSVGYWPICGNANPEPDRSGNARSMSVGYYAVPPKGPSQSPFTNMCCSGGSGSRYSIS